MTTTIRAESVMPLYEFYKRQGGCNAVVFAEMINNGEIIAIDTQNNIVDVRIEG